MYDLTGKVTHGGEPVLIGDVVLEPLQGPVTGQTVIRTSVVEGEYRTRTVGGPHRVNVRDFSGDPEMGGEEYANARPRFRREYSGKVELPALDSVEEGQTVTQDIEIPASHR